MPNEMMRPCTLWGQTFDACKVVALNEERKESAGHHVRVCVSTPHPSNPYDSRCVVLSPHFMPPLEAFQEAITTIDDALKAPVLATDELLAGLPRDARAVAVTSSGSERIVWLAGFVQHWRLIGAVHNEPVCNKHHIQAFECSKTAEYLCQFTLDGVRKETNDV